MGEIRTAQPVKVITGVLLPGPREWVTLRGELESLWGAIDLETPMIPFTYTDYYTREMGPLMRVYVAFSPLAQPNKLVELKCAASALEDRRRREDGTRTVNVDPGYLGLPQLVLASTKPFAHRIYLDQGIYAEVTLLFRDDSFHGLPWTYSDYQAHIPLFNEWRMHLKKQLDQSTVPPHGVQEGIGRSDFSGQGKMGCSRANLKS